jgi:hypothetical protein
MVQTADETVVALDGAVYVADIGTAIPTDPTVIGAGWEDLGYITREGVTFELSREITDIDAWQESDPIRRLVTRVPKLLRFTLQQLSTLTFPFAFGGGVVTEPSPGIFDYEPPDPSEIDERMLLWQFIDDVKTYVIGYRRGQVTGTASMTGVRDNVNLLPVEYSVLAPGGGVKPFFFLTDDPAFEPTGS